MRRVAIRISLLGALLALILALSGAILAVNVLAGKAIADDLAARYLDKTVELVRRRMDGFFDPVRESILAARSWARAGVVDPHDAERSNAVYLPILRAYPQVTSIASGDEEGYSYRLGAEGEDFLNRLTFAGEPGRPAEYALRRADGSLLRAYEQATTFDPRERPWYATARAAYERAGNAKDAALAWTDPFVLNTSRNPGIAASLPFDGADGRPYMMTFNVMLTKLSDFTAGLRPTEHGVAFLLASDGRVLGFPADDRFPTPESRVELVKRQENEMPRLEAFEVPSLTAAEAHWRDARAKGGAARFRFDAASETFRATFTPYALAPETTLWIGVVVPEADFLTQVQHQRHVILLVSALALLGSVLLALWLARLYGRPLRRLAEQSERMTSLDLAQGEPVRSHVLETHQLATAQERMRAALESFSRYVPTEVVRELLRRGEAARLGGRSMPVTVLFSDVRDFTTISEGMSPEDLTQHLAEYFQSLLDIIRSEHGAVDKMIGDAIMALFGAPVAHPTHAADAVRAALRCQQFLAGFNARCLAAGRPALATGFGLSHGEAFVGNIGAPQRLNYTALGDVVNLASRLESLSKRYGCGILCSESVRDAAGEDFLWRLVDLVAVKGKTKPVRVFEPLGLVGQVGGDVLAFAGAYERAFARYRERDFDAALIALEEAARLRPDDASVERLADLCRTWSATPPPPDWDGAARMTEK